MSEKEFRHRMSATQKSILITLYVLSRKLPGPFEVGTIRKIINKDRCQSNFTEIQVSNFSVSCKTLFTRGLLRKFRDKNSLKVLYSLTEDGHQAAEKEYDLLVKSLSQNE
ncbi:hypothetical protein ACI0X9_003301 [Cronobacter turicensis]